MSLKKIIVAISLPLFLTSLLSSQSLVDLAKKEKERRERLKGKKKIVITNADLKSLGKRPAVTTSRPMLPAGGTERLASPSEKSLLDKAEPSKAKGKVADKDKAETKRKAEAKDIDRSEPQEETPQELEAKWKKAREYVGLLTTKMNGLWQEFYSMDDMTSREKIQREISETSLRLQKAKEDEARARGEYKQARTGARMKIYP